MALTILGIDPGLRVTGYAVVSSNDDGPSLCEAGVFRTVDKESLEKRLKSIYDGLEEVVREFRPDTIAVEKLYSHYGHPQTAVIMGHARGMIFLCAAKHETPVRSYGATRIKKSLTGNGRASKLQMQRTVKSIFGMKALPEPADVADAIAAALCHIETVK